MIGNNTGMPMIFTDGVDISVGRGETKDGWLYFTSIGKWGEPIKTYKIPRDLIEYYHSICKFYDPHTKTEGGNDEWKIYWFSLKTFNEFNYKESTPAQIVHENNMLKNKLNIVQAENEELLQLLNTNSIQDAKKRMVSEMNKWMRDNVGYGGGNMGQPGTINKGENK